ncbi:glycosyltransferase [Teredinibacter turnerae]|uniref:glycosyltransferase n=1 Tax=Teredinibacter turnerae TaxID=2426 RepID=UPI00035C85FB|nr:glycosyltransferase [Teredinibacter turnerae]
MKLMYIVSTLARGGPTNQLYYLVTGAVERGCEVCVVTLSPEPSDTMVERFIDLQIRFISLGMSRISTLFKAKRDIDKLIKEVKPEVIHTQGIRADSLVSSLESSIRDRWILTSRNYPFHDYPMKYGKLKGWFMAIKHIDVHKKCKNVVACSSSISKLLSKKGVFALAIRNGAQPGSPSETFQFNVNLEKPVYVTVGSLIERKNIRNLISAFDNYKKQGGKGCLLVIGDGPLSKELKRAFTNSIYYEGNVSNVPDYLSLSDCFVSASLSEGMPNAVLEALLFGLPCILSDIEPHKELFGVAGERKVNLFSNGDIVNLSSIFSSYDLLRLEKGVVDRINDELSCKGMIRKYQELYRKVRHVS